MLYSDGVVVFGQKWLYSNKIGCIPAKVELLGQNGFIRAKKVGKKGSISAKVIVLEQKWLYSG